MISAQNLPTIPKVALFFSGINFPSSSYIKLKQRKATQNNDWIELNTSEAVHSTNSPHYATEMRIEYIFSIQQYLRVEVYRADTKTMVGTAEFTLAEACKSANLKLPLQKSPSFHTHDEAFLVVKAENSSDCQDEVLFQFTGRFVKKYFFQPKSYITLWRSMESGLNGNFQKIYQTAWNTGHTPIWPEIRVKTSHLCNNSYQTPIKLQVHKKHPMQSERVVGSIIFTLYEIFETGQRNFEIQKEVKGVKQKKPHIKLFLHKSEIIKQPYFLDYVMAGCEMALLSAVDFTKSNLEFSDPASLHYIYGDKPSQYEEALAAVSDILLCYDTDKMVPIYGFGAEIKTTGQVSHCFPLTLQEDHVEVYGVQGVVDCYRGVMPSITFSGPTLFAPLIRHTINMIKREMCESSTLKYYILMILTDGQVNDEQQTIDYIVQATYEVPLSIVIVGIGKGPWDLMHKFDADDVPLVDSKGRQMESDIVQFVEFASCGNNGVQLAREVLDEIPRQMTDFFKRKNMAPGDKWQVSKQNAPARYSFQQRAGSIDVNFAPRGQTNISLPQENSMDTVSPPNKAIYQRTMTLPNKVF
jgi:hypothetical protein